MDLSNIDYKKILFTRYDGVSVSLSANLTDPFNLDENFLIHKITGINSVLETKFFYWINKGRWTLNEMVFFAVNNDMCLTITSKEDEYIISYGNCSTHARVFDLIFGINFD